MFTDTMPIPLEQKPARVMIVDDDPSITQVYALALTKFGYSVLGRFADGTDVVKYFQDHRLELEPSTIIVIMDYQMPKMNGLEAAIRLKSIYQELKIILATAYSFAEINYAMKLFDGILQKPFEMKSLLHAVQSAFTNVKQ